MGCGASQERADLDPDAQHALKTRDRRRRREGRGYLSSDPTSLSDYKQVLKHTGAISSDDEATTTGIDNEVEVVLREAREITVITRTESSIDFLDDEPAPHPALRKVRSALRSKITSPTHLNSPTLQTHDVSLRTSPYIPRTVSFRVGPREPGDAELSDRADGAIAEDHLSEHRPFSMASAYETQSSCCGDNDDEMIDATSESP